MLNLFSIHKHFSLQVSPWYLPYSGTGSINNTFSFAPSRQWWIREFFRVLSLQACCRRLPLQWNKILIGDFGISGTGSVNQCFICPTLYKSIQCCITITSASTILSKLRPCRLSGTLLPLSIQVPLCAIIDLYLLEYFFCRMASFCWSIYELITQKIWVSPFVGLRILLNFFIHLGSFLN